jgi:outer membrane biosynthesis protein TonB
MREAVNDVLALRAHDARGLSRMITWSLVVHAAAILTVAFAPRSWFERKAPVVHVMEISLGSSGPKDSGQTTIGGRPVEVAAPEPKRPEPVKPALAKPDVMTVPVKAAPPKPVKTPPPPPKRVIEQAQAPSPTPQPPTTGRQVAPGNSRAETGVTGLGSGLTIGGGGQGSSSLLSDFCCNAYLQEIVKRIKNNWQEQQPERGSVVMRFTVQRNGTVTDVAVERPGSFLLNMASQRPFNNLRMPPLPDEYKEPNLIIHLTFEYK